MPTVSVGAFINLLYRAPDRWESDFRSLQQFVSPDHVEIWAEYLPTQAERARLQRMLGGLPILVHAPFIHLSLASHLSKIRALSKQRCEKAIDLARYLGAKAVTLHGGSYPFHESRTVAIHRVAESVGEWASNGEVIVAVENMPQKAGTTHEAVDSLTELAMIKTLVPNVHFTVDIGHCIQNGEEFSAFFRMHADNIVDVHLHDAVRGGRGHLAAGQGELDIPLLRSVLGVANYTKFVTIETLTLEDTITTHSAWMAAAAVRKQPRVVEAR